MSFFKRSVRPSDVISDLTTELLSCLGETLQSVVLHGIHADPAKVDDESPIDLLIVLADFNPATMKRLASGYQQVRGHQLVMPMVLTRIELNSSTDVFPITFLEMKRQYKVLVGDDVLCDLQIGVQHLRLRCEQELKNLMLRMQNQLLKNYFKPKRLRQAMKRNHATLTRILFAALQMQGHECRGTQLEILDTGLQEFGLNQDAMRRVTEAVGDRTPIHADALRSLYSEFITVVSQAAAAIDALPIEDAIVELIGETGEIE